MSTQTILAGSTGKYNPIDPDIFGNTEFTVIKDTPLKSDTITVLFNGGIHKTRIHVSRVTWIDLKKI